MVDPLYRLQDLFRSLAQEVSDLIAANPNASGWNDAFIDVRYSHDGTSWGRNTQATVAGSPVSLAVGSATLNELIQAIWQTPVDEQFYGFVLSLNTRGEVQIQLNYDPDCLADPRFWS